jgi:hypothetical protein
VVMMRVLMGGSRARSAPRAAYVLHRLRVC